MQEMRNRQRYEAIRNSVKQSEAQNIGALARANPTLSPGVLYSAGRAGIQPGTPEFHALSQGDVKKKASSGGWSVGKLVSGAYRGARAVGSALLPDAVGDTVNAAAPVVKGVSRGAFGLASAIPESIQATFRESAEDGIQAHEWIDWVARLDNHAEQTSMGQIVKQIKERRSLKGISAGSGFFIGGQAAKDQKAEVLAQGRMSDGKGVTIGRYFANKFVEPGTKAYGIVSGLVDASIAVGADPTTFATAPTKGLQARRLFTGDASKGFDATKALEDAGAVEGLRKTVNSDRALEWLTTKAEGQNVVAYLAREKNIARMMKNTNYKLDPELMVQLVNTEPEDTAKVIALLGPHLGRAAKLEQKFNIDAQGLADAGLSSGAMMGGRLGTFATGQVQRRIDRARLLGRKPGDMIVKDDKPAAMRMFDDAMRNAKFSDEERAPYLMRLAQTDDHAQMLEIVTDFARDTVLKMTAPTRTVTGRVRPGLPKSEADKIAQLYKDKVAADRLFWQDQIGRNKAFGKDKDVVKLANGQIAPQPHFAAQMLDSAVPLPNAREIRRAISPYRNLLSNKAVETPLAVVEKITDNIFKPFALLRPAYMVRNALDEQFRPAAVGLNTMFNHPVQYMNWLMHDQAGLAKVLRKATAGKVHGGRGQVDITNAAFDEERQVLRLARVALEDATRTGKADDVAEAQRQYDYAKKALGSRGPLQDGASAYVRSLEGGVGNWRNRSVTAKEGYALIQRNEAPYSQALAEALHMIHLDPVGVRVARGNVIPGDAHAGKNTGIDAIKDWHWDGSGQGFRKDLSKTNERMKWLEDRAGADTYVDDTEAFLRDHVGDSQVLREAAATGKINGVDLTIGDDLKINPAAIAEIDKLKLTDELPAAVGGKTSETVPGGVVAGYDRAVEWLYKQLGSRPSDYLARSPIFRQRYYQRIENLIEYAHPQVADKMIENARAADMKDTYLRRLEAKRHRGSEGTMSLREIDEVAKADALDFTKNLVYDLSTRSQFFDAARVLFPFGEAFANTAKTYSRVAAKNPVVPYRLGQVIGGGRDADLDGDGKGFFYTDEQTGQEMFNWPMSGLFGEQLGISGFKSPLAGLNLMGGQVLPGFGPVVQIAAASILPSDPDFDGVRKMISPYGDRNIEGGALESFLPAWVSKFRSAELIPFLNASPAQARAFGEAQKDVMAYLVSTGEYSVDTEENQRILVAEAKKRTRAVFLLRGMAQSIVPSPPSPAFAAKDKDGRMYTQFKLAERLNELQKEDYDSALPKFINEFGVDALMAAMSNTKAADGVSPVPATKDGIDFLRRNREAFDRHSDVFGLFAPSGGDFDMTAYQEQIRSGQRVSLTPKELEQKVNGRVATMLYNQAKKQAGDSIDKEEAKRLREYKQELVSRYPGYDPASTTSPEVLIDKLKNAVNDPVLGNTPAGKATVLYLQAREQAEEFAQRKYKAGFKRSQAAAPIRERMRQYAEQLSSEYDGFGDLFQRSFEREMVDD